MFRIPTKYNSRDFFKLLLLLYWAKDFTWMYIRAVLLRLPVIWKFADYILPGLIVVCVLLAFPYMMKRFSYKDLVFFLCSATAYCVNLLIYQNTSEYLLENALTIWGTVFPLYFLGLRLEPEEDVPILYQMSMVNLWLFFLYTTLFGTGMSETQSLHEGSMGRAYSLLPQILLVFIFAVRKTNVWNVATFAVSAVYLTYCGTRGALVCLFLFVFLFILLCQSFRSNWGLYFVLALVMLLFLLFYEEILIFMRMVAREIGMSERIFNALLSDSFFESHGRSTYLRATLAGIATRPITGYGIAGDRGIIGTYCHNVFLEFLVSYGIFIGAILLILLMELIRRGFFNSETIYEKSMVLMLFCASFVKLNLSSSYLLEGLFFLMIGVCVNLVRKQAEQRKI